MEVGPLYFSWPDYLARTTRSERMQRCYQAAKRANRVQRCLWRRKPSGSSVNIVAAIDNQLIKGPCGCCGSLPGGPCTGENKLSGRDIWMIIEAANGRCMYCRSLAVEGRPSQRGTGAPLSWGHMGRRIGSLEHIGGFLDGRRNHLANLAWACLWCNVHREARRPFSNDAGGFYPP
jgi:hypothetical protein